MGIRHTPKFAHDMVVLCVVRMPRWLTVCQRAPASIASPGDRD